MWVRIRSTGAASVTKAMMRPSAPQLGQTSGKDSNSRANSMAQRQRGGDRALRACAVEGAAISSRAIGSSAASRPYAVAAARSGKLGASTRW